MNKFKKTNALTVAIILSVIIIFSCSVILVLHNEFGIILGEKNDNTNYTIELAVYYDGYIDIKEGEHLYLFESRESLGWVNNIKYAQDGTMLITVSANGFKQNDSILLNGTTYIAKGTRLFIMNNKIEVEILNIM